MQCDNQLRSKTSGNECSGDSSSRGRSSSHTQMFASTECPVRCIWPVSCIRPVSCVCAFWGANEVMTAGMLFVACAVRPSFHVLTQLLFLLQLIAKTHHFLCNMMKLLVRRTQQVCSMASVSHMAQIFSMQYRFLEVYTHILFLYRNGTTKTAIKYILSCKHHISIELNDTLIAITQILWC